MTRSSLSTLPAAPAAGGRCSRTLHVEIADASHRMHEEQPAAVDDAILAFLRRVSARQPRRRARAGRSLHVEFVTRANSASRMVRWSSGTDAS